MLHSYANGIRVNILADNSHYTTFSPVLSFFPIPTFSYREEEKKIKNKGFNISLFKIKKLKNAILKKFLSQESKILIYICKKFYNNISDIQVFDLLTILKTNIT